MVAPELPAPQQAAPAQRLCLACGAPNPVEARFCNQCGAYMGGDTASPQPDISSDGLLPASQASESPAVPDEETPPGGQPADELEAALVGDTGTPLFPPQEISQPKPPATSAHAWLWPAVAVAVLILFCMGALLVGAGAFWLSTVSLASSPTRAALAALPPTWTSAPARPSPTWTTPARVQPSATDTSPSETPLPLPTDTPRPTRTPTPAGPSGKIVFSCQMDGENRDQVCIINADGTGWRQLTDNGKHNWYASLAPDGQTVIFSSNLGGDYEIYEVSAFGGAPVRLTSRLGGKLYAPEISPDGRKIVFTHDDGGNQSVWVINRDGSGPLSLAVGWDPSWSPDGSQILYASSTTGGAVQLYVMNADGSNQRKVTNLPKLRGRSDWSPLGLIATYAGDYGKRSLWLMNADGSDAQEYYFNPTSAAPSFSPDGLWMAFTGYLDYSNDLDKGCEIYIVRVGETNAIRLTNNRYYDWQPRWGP